jgi:ribosomal protein S12 methylthiotransferase
MAREEKKTIVVAFIALGCPKNVVDSEKMLGEIAQKGFLITSEPDNSDVVVINTCGFIAPAKDEADGVIENTLQLKRKGRVKKVIVTGCLPERIGIDIFSEHPGVDALVGLSHRDRIANIIRETLCADKPIAYLEKAAPTVCDDTARLLIGPPHRAYLRISQGCNHRCSFCTIPAIRGPFRSKPKQRVLKEAVELASAGVVELNVIAQDTTFYGQDLQLKNGLVTLLRQLEEIDGLVWMRLMYMYPAGMNDKLLEVITNSEKIVPYLDIPIQHINNRILKSMRRPDTGERLYRLIERVRSIIPNVVLRTTVIVGFPGESDKEFAELLDFIRWAQFDALGCFTFCPESGTDAAKLPEQVSDQLKRKRYHELMLTQQKIAFVKNEERMGIELICLVDSVSKNGTGRGRFYGQAPDIDSICHIQKCTAQPGQFIKTEVAGTKDYDLIVRQI